MRKTTAINLELMKDNDAGIKFYAKQFDDLKLKAKIFDGLDEVNVLGQKITVCIVKEDKTVIEQTDNISIEENTIIVNLSKQATTALGKCTMEILLTDEEGTASTSTISYIVGEKLSASIVEMIKSEDDINVLNLIEEFIQTSNVDILDIKEAITELRDTANNAQGSINAELESIVGTLRALEGTIIENINVKGNEAITTANNAVTKANEAVTKADEVLVEVEGAKGFIAEVTTEKDRAIEAITTAKTTATGEIDTAKLDALSAVSERGTNVGQDLTAMTNVLKGEITSTGTLETNKVIEANTGALSAIEEAKTSAISLLGAEATKVEEALNVTVSQIKKQAETDLNACKTDLDAYILLAKEQGKTDLNGIKDGVILEVNNLKSEVDNVLASITQKVTESNSNIEELTALIEEAKIVAGLVREFIETNSSSVDLSNYYTKEETDNKIDEKISLIPPTDLSGYYNKIETEAKIDEKIGLINIPEVDLSNYYTKEDIDNTLSNKVDKVEGKGLSTNDFTNELKSKLEGLNDVDLSDYYNKKEIEAIKDNLNDNIYKVDTNMDDFDYVLLTKQVREYPPLSTLPENTFVNIPENPDPATYRWTMKCTSYNYHMIFYFPEDPTGKFGVFKDSTGEHFKLLDTSFKYSTYKGWYKAQTTTTRWTAFSTDNHFTDITRILNAMYEHNFDIVDANNPTEIYYKVNAEHTPNIVIDFNDCIKYKKYKVSQEAGDVLLNSPLDTTFTGILDVEKTDNYIKQILTTTDNIQYRRIFNGVSWSEWKKEITQEDILELIASSSANI